MSGRGSCEPVLATSPSPSVDQSEPANGSRRLRTAAWVTGATFLLLGKSKANSFNNDNTCDLNDAGGVIGGSHCQDIYDSWHTNRTIGIVSLSLGAALAATSAVLFVKTQGTATAAGQASQALAACGLGSGRGVVCAVRF
ncbi:MAG TPA: hypothetical protein VH374_20260 [Polyangia bacterium]|nr:hypothetical protein [Polyangia bacterium]